jgi:small conductance mechanosensitive channel
MDWKDKVLDFLLLNGPKLLGGLIIITAGGFVAGWVRRMAERVMEKKQFEPPVRMLFGRIIHVLVMLFAIIIALDTIGFEMTSIIAGISVAGVGIGLAMQGVLSNLVAGLLIIFTKKFRVGEYVDLLGEEGVVDRIELFTTTLKHPDLSRIVIPNRKIVGEVLHNYGTIRQLELTVGVAYSTDLATTIAIVREVLNQQPRVLKDPAPVVGVTTLADSSINLTVKPWTAVADYLPARAELYQAIIERFRQRNVQIPFPQREVRMLSN